MADKNKNPINPRLGKVGGQAVIEGVMMKSGEELAIASRMPDKSIKITKQKFVSVRKKYKFLNIPILRGVINFVEMMILSYKTLDISTQALGIEEEPESKFEKWLNDKFGDKIMNFIMILSTILGVLLAIFLFTVLPTGFTNLLTRFTGKEESIFANNYIKSIIEGILKVVIFIVYLALVSLMKDIRRTFEYHGAEHKSVFCYEQNLELTVENVRKQSRFHPRCGTSFMFVMIFLGIIIGLFIPTWSSWLRPIIKTLLLPINVGLGFEFIMIAGKHDNALTRALSAPGLWIQRLTTKEPDDEEIECAIAALKNALPEEFPEVLEESSEQDDTEDSDTADAVNEEENTEQ